MKTPLSNFFRYESERLVQNGQPPLSDDEIEELILMCRTAPFYARERLDEYFKARQERLAKKSPPSDSAHLEGLAVDLL